MKVLMTGGNGFIGRNLRLHLSERKDVQVVRFTREHGVGLLPKLLQGVDFVFHLAGENRPQDPAELTVGNVDLTRALCTAVVDMARAAGHRIPILYTSSTQASLDNPYGRSKREAEVSLRSDEPLVPAHVFRLPNVFGKWCRPNYNSVVATFCHNITRGLPIQIHNPQTELTLVYVDDVVRRFVQLMDGAAAAVDADGFETVTPQYIVTVGELAQQLESFRSSRSTLITDRVGGGWARALYATYVSYLPTEAFSYEVPRYVDPRGVFVEMLKTQDSGQFSYFTAHPGVTRGGHYHHSKSEKFLVIQGNARFRFRHMQSGQVYELTTSSAVSRIVETVPGWAHDITNVGSDELVVILWANEVFDSERPDTYENSVCA